MYCRSHVSAAIKPEWDQLKQWAVKYSPAVSKSNVFDKENPMADMLALPVFDSFGKANVVYDWEKHYWEVRAIYLF